MSYERFQPLPQSQKWVSVLASAPNRRDITSCTIDCWAELAITEIEELAKISRYEAVCIVFLRWMECMGYRSLPGDQINSEVSGLLPRDEETERELFSGPTTQAINFSNYENIPVRSSSQIPSMDNFSSLDLGPVIQNSLLLCHYTHPTPIQKHAIPALLDGVDLLGCAQTGSGEP
jgi:hypothetical protein